MKTFLLATSALIAATFTASAADLAARPYTKAPVAPIVAAYDWSGFYIGAHGGYAWGNTHSDIYLASGAFFNSGSTNRDGGFGGGQIGFNAMLSPNWLIGIEADIAGSDIKSRADGCSATGCSITDSRINYFGTVRGRLGYAANNVLIYGTGGLLWANMSVDRSLYNVAPPGTALNGQVAHASSTPTGWTAGGGVEWGFAPNWSAKVEYLYGELDTHSTFVYNFVNNNPTREYDSRHQLHTIKVGINYRFGGAPVVAKY